MTVGGSLTFADEEVDWILVCDVTTEGDIPTDWIVETPLWLFVDDIPVARCCANCPFLITDVTGLVSEVKGPLSVTSEDKIDCLGNIGCIASDPNWEPASPVPAKLKEFPLNWDGEIGSMENWDCGTLGKGCVFCSTFVDTKDEPELGDTFQLSNCGTEGTDWIFLSTVDVKGIESKLFWGTEGTELIFVWSTDVLVSNAPAVTASVAGTIGCIGNCVCGSPDTDPVDCWPVVVNEPDIADVWITSPEPSDGMMDIISGLGWATEKPPVLSTPDIGPCWENPGQNPLLCCAGALNCCPQLELETIVLLKVGSVGELGCIPVFPLKPVCVDIQLSTFPLKLACVLVFVLKPLCVFALKPGCVFAFTLKEVSVFALLSNPICVDIALLTFPLKPVCEFACKPVCVFVFKPVVDCRSVFPLKVTAVGGNVGKV